MSVWDERGSGAINWKKNLAVLWIGVFLACASYTSCIPFLPVYLMKELHVASDEVNFWSGIVYAVAFLGASVMAPYWGAWADKVGQRKMAIRAGLGLAVTYVFGGIVQTAFQMFLVRGITGLISGYVPASMALISSTLPKEKMGWGMGLMQTAVGSGVIMGPLLGGYLSVWFGMRMSFFVGAIALFIATFMTVIWVRDIPFSEEKAKKEIHLIQDLKASLKNRGVLYVMFMFFLIQACGMIIQPLVTLYVSDLMGGTGPESIKMSGWVFSLAGIAGIIAAPYWGKRGQAKGYAKTLTLVLVCAGLVNLTQIFVDNIWQFAVIQFIYGIFLAGAIPNINSTLVDVTSQDMRGKAFGLVTSAQQFGGVIGPLIGGFLGSLMNTPHVLFTTGLILIITAAATSRVKLQKAE